VGGENVRQKREYRYYFIIYLPMGTLTFRILYYRRRDIRPTDDVMVPIARRRSNDVLMGIGNNVAPSRADINTI